jgi:pyrroloquinoline quinone biosynthesis protein B
MSPNEPILLADGIQVTAVLVPHRDEFTDTVGYVIARQGRRGVLFIPDIDQWGKWWASIRELVDTVDLALLDGTFASADELPGRSIDDIPHPLIPATRPCSRARPPKSGLST